MVFFIQRGVVFANKSQASIEAPESVAKGSEITIKITVTHNGNNFLHYTKWLRVTAGDKEIARWDFSMSQKPEAAFFNREVKFTVTDHVEITAEASCNIHGSAGPSTVKIMVKE